LAATVREMARAVGSRWKRAAPGGAALMRFVTPAISIIVLGAALLALRAIDARAVIALVPRSPLFWIVFVIVYVTPIAADWAIYRRVWGLPFGGVVPLARKLISNELVFGYLGDAYLYTWACRHGRAPGDGLRTIKDVAILSAVASNVTTLVVAALALPYLGLLAVHLPAWAVIASLALILAPLLAASLFGRRLFSLPRPMLRWALGAHMMRALATCFLTALLWHLALPEVALKWWVVFAALRLVLSRLPFVSNKDVLLAGLALILLGSKADVTALLTMIATLTVTAHIAVSVAISARDLAGGLNERMRLRNTQPLPAA
jgi:hypothetical protein